MYYTLKNGIFYFMIVFLKYSTMVERFSRIQKIVCSNSGRNNPTSLEVPLPNAQQQVFLCYGSSDKKKT